MPPGRAPGVRSPRGPGRPSPAAEEPPGLPPRRQIPAPLQLLGPRRFVPLPLQRAGAAGEEELVAGRGVAVEGEPGGFLDGEEEGVEGGGGEPAHSAGPPSLILRLITHKPMPPMMETQPKGSRKKKARARCGVK